MGRRPPPAARRPPMDWKCPDLKTWCEMSFDISFGNVKKCQEMSGNVRNLAYWREIGRKFLNSNSNTFSVITQCMS